MAAEKVVVISSGRRRAVAPMIVPMVAPRFVLMVVPLVVLMVGPMVSPKVHPTTMSRRVALELET